MVAWVTGGRSNPAVSADLPRRNGEDHAPKGDVARLVRPHCVSQQPSFIAFDCQLIECKAFPGRSSFGSALRTHRLTDDSVADVVDDDAKVVQLAHRDLQVAPNLRLGLG